MSFKKNRIGNKRVNIEEVLYNKRRELKNKEDAKSKSDLEEVNNELARISQEKFNKIKEEISGNKKDSSAMNPMKMWRLKTHSMSLWQLLHRNKQRATRIWVEMMTMIMKMTLNQLNYYQATRSC